MVGPKIILMALYSILLQTINLLFPPLESLPQCLWYSEQEESHSHFPTGKCPKLH